MNLMKARRMQRRPPRDPSLRSRQIRDWREILRLLTLLFLALVSSSNAARAGAPFLTDDPGFAPQGWEIRPQASYEHNVNGAISIEAVDINYAIVPTFKLDLTPAIKQVHPNGAGSANGVADTDFKFKWRFLEDDPSG